MALDTIFVSNYLLFFFIRIWIRLLLIHKNNFRFKTGIIYKAVKLNRMEKIDWRCSIRLKVKFVNFSNEYNLIFFLSRNSSIEESLRGARLMLSPRFENNLKTLTVYKTGYPTERLRDSRGRSYIRMKIKR